MLKRVGSIFLSLSLVFCCALTPVYAYGSINLKNVEKAQAIEKLNKLSNGELTFNEDDGQVFLSGNLSNKQTAGEKNANKFLDENKTLFGIDSTNELKVVNTEKDELGDTFVKYVQLINGIEVNNSSISVHFNKDGIIVSVNGNLIKNKDITTLGNKNISEKDAIETAKKQYNFKSLRNTPKAEKLILNKDNKNYEVYKVNISYFEPEIANYDVYVETHSGKVIQTEDNIRYNKPVTGTGVDVLGKTRSLNLYEHNSDYYMIDETKTQPTLIATIDYNDQTYPVASSTTSFTTKYDRASVSAHYNAGQVIDFYKNLFNRNSLDGNGMQIYSYTHVTQDNKPYNNACWDGAEMIYGDGDGNMFTSLSGDLDVVGHEMTHGVTAKTAKLAYHTQSGALNESMSDVFGVLIETYNKDNVAHGGNWAFNPADWVVGDEIYTPNKPGDALRSLSNPTLYGQPDKMSSYVNYPDTQLYDWGGVHTNSGITNKAAYIAAQRIGMSAIAQIYYRALTKYMNSTTDFAAAERYLIQASTDLYGKNSAQTFAINYAYYSVGIGSAPTQIVPIRYAGSSRFDTAVKISQAGWRTSQNVVLAYGYDFADALTGVPVAKKLDAPILLTDTNSIPKATSDEIKRLGAKNIYILGGTGVISGNLEKQLQSSKYNVIRLSGKNRFETAINIDNTVLLNNPTKTAVLTTAYNYPDALAISSYAAINKFPILYTEATSLNAQTSNFIKTKGIKQIIIPGGTGAVSDSVEKALKNSGVTVTRISGVNRYDTAFNIVNKYKSSFKNQVIIATGDNFPDALAGGAFAAKYQIPILLVDSNTATVGVRNYALSRCIGQNMFILGGTGVVPDSVVRSILN